MEEEGHRKHTFVGTIWNGLQKQFREAKECCQEGLLHESDQRSNNQNMTRNTGHKGQAQELLQGNKIAAEN